MIVGGRLVLEDAAVGSAREEPEPGDDLGPVVPPPLLVLVAGEETAHQAVEPAGRAVGQLDAEADGLAHDLGGLDRVVVGDHLQVVAEQPRDLLDAREGRQLEHVLAQRRLEDQEPVCLFQSASATSRCTTSGACRW